MSSHKYTRSTGDLTIKESDSPGEVFVWIHEGMNNAAIHIAKEDAPAVAAELLKAAGQDDSFIPKAYEGVERLGDELTCGSGPEWVGASIHANPNWLRNKAANCIAIAEYIENKKQREADAEKKLQERRDALVRKFGGGGGSYAATDFPLQQAVDAYIELEDGQTK